MPIDDIAPTPDVMAAKPQRIEVGRADLTELTRRLGARLRADQLERKANPNGGDQVRSHAIALAVYPCEWSPLTGHVVGYEACTTEKVGGLGTYVRSRGNTPRQAAFRMRWTLVNAIAKIRNVPIDAAKRIVRKCHIEIVDVLPEQPPEMKG